MTHEQFSMMMAAARDIVQRFDAWNEYEARAVCEGMAKVEEQFPLDPLTVEWARKLLAANPMHPQSSLADSKRSPV